MTKLVLSALLLASPAAFAAFNEYDDVGYPEVKYFSWCVHNVVMEEGARGKPVLKADCDELKLKCVQEERLLGPTRVSFATCKPARR